MIFSMIRWVYVESKAVRYTPLESYVGFKMILQRYWVGGRRNWIHKVEVRSEKWVVTSISNPSKGLPRLAVYFWLFYYHSESTLLANSLYEESAWLKMINSVFMLGISGVAAIREMASGQIPSHVSAFLSAIWKLGFCLWGLWYL